MEKSGDGKGLKQLRVDNWSNFMLQKLQLLFAKGDSCDITLKFKTGQEIKVHSLVLRTCTSHFDTFPKRGDVIELPEAFPYTALFPIINFMYSGKLEYKAELQGKLQQVAKILNLTVLLKLLVAQKDGGGAVGATVKTKQNASPSDANKTKCKISLSQTPSPSGSLFQGRKLPFWRKRSFPVTPTRDRKPVEVATGPIRYSLPDSGSLDWVIASSPSFTSLSYDCRPVVAREKRSGGGGGDQDDDLLKTEMAAGDESSRGATGPTRRVLESRLLTSHDSDSDEDRFPTGGYSSEEEDNPPPATATPKPTEKQPQSQETTPSTPAPPPAPVQPTSLKPCLKTPSSTTPTTTAAPSQTKRVRFSIDDEPVPQKDKEVSEEETTKTTEQTMSTTETPESTNTSNTTTFSLPTTSPPTANHAKIIAEVLKKYPDLVKNKNIKLKITSPKLKTENGVMSSDEKASYVVLKPALKNFPGSTPVRGPPPPSPELGPFFCEHCSKLKFTKYPEYRKHIQEVHNEKIDSRICEHCGHRSSKRNLHLYHLFTRHNVQPPAHMKFPKCTDCPHIALSESLLVKHMNNHKNSSKQTRFTFTCDNCSVSFPHQTILVAHKLKCKPGSGNNFVTCDLCKSNFRNNVSLNEHLKECQGKEESKGEGTTETSEGDEGQSIEMIEVPIIETVNEKGDHTLVQIPSGIILTDNSNVALLPSSESEALTNVSSGIATSLGLVALPQEQSTLILLQGNGPEYIVPDFLEGSFGPGQLAYTSQNQLIYIESSPGNDGNNEQEVLIEEMNDQTASTSADGDKNIKENETQPDVISKNETIIIAEGDSTESGENVESDTIILIEPDNEGPEQSLDSDDKESTTETTTEVAEKDKQQSSETVVKPDEIATAEESPKEEAGERVTSEIAEKDAVATEKDAASNLTSETTAEIVKAEVPLSSDENEKKSEDIEGNAIPDEIPPLETKDKDQEPASAKSTVETIRQDTTKEMMVDTTNASSEAEQMQVEEESREDMIVDEDKEATEQMDVEESDLKEGMDIEETDKTTDERAQSLVKDWSFDDEETPEVVTNPDLKPLRLVDQHSNEDEPFLFN